MTVSFADVAQQNVSFNPDDEAGGLLLRLIDTAWVQRLRDISQTANTRLVYMFSEHSRFGHSLGVASLALQLLDKLAINYKAQVAPYRTAVCAAALLHDIGHIAPGSHTAFKTWFPGKKDTHEETSNRVIENDPEIRSALDSISPTLREQVCAILTESEALPRWSWEIISGGGWNVDRGNWCIIDSILAGVSYGQYNIPALTESIVITPEGDLALRENRLDAMMHFALSRHAMYKQIYQHRVILAADTLNQAVVQRLRDLPEEKRPYCDDSMRAVLNADHVNDLPIEVIAMMRESWWRYHLLRWSQSNDAVVADLSKRLLQRRLFKTVRIQETDTREELLAAARVAVTQAGFDPKYYLHTVSTANMQAGDSAQSMKVLLDNGSTRSFAEAEPLFGSLVRESKHALREWIVLPAEAKTTLGRVR